MKSRHYMLYHDEKKDRTPPDVQITGNKITVTKINHMQLCSEIEDTKWEVKKPTCFRKKMSFLFFKWRFDIFCVRILRCRVAFGWACSMWCRFIFAVDVPRQDKKCLVLYLLARVLSYRFQLQPSVLHLFYTLFAFDCVWSILRVSAKILFNRTVYMCNVQPKTKTQSTTTLWHRT